MPFQTSDLWCLGNCRSPGEEVSYTLAPSFLANDNNKSLTWLSANRTCSNSSFRYTVSFDALPSAGTRSKIEKSKDSFTVTLWLIWKTILLIPLDYPDIQKRTYRSVSVLLRVVKKKPTKPRVTAWATACEHQFVTSRVGFSPAPSSYRVVNIWH